jgi:hypothetical protein
MNWQCSTRRAARCGVEPGTHVHAVHAEQDPGAGDTLTFTETWRPSIQGAIPPLHRSRARTSPRSSAPSSRSRPRPSACVRQPRTAVARRPLFSDGCTCRPTPVHQQDAYQPPTPTLLACRALASAWPQIGDHHAPREIGGDTVTRATPHDDRPELLQQLTQARKRLTDQIGRRIIGQLMSSTTWSPRSRRRARTVGRRSGRREAADPDGCRRR